MESFTTKNIHEALLKKSETIRKLREERANLAAKLEPLALLTKKAFKDIRELGDELVRLRARRDAVVPRRRPRGWIGRGDVELRRIVAVEQVRDPHADRDALKISVFMNVFNVHSNRAPVDGTVQKVQYFPGKFVNADLDKASLENERNAVVLRRPDGQLVTSVQVAGLIARRILCYTKAGETLARGQRYGFIRFGSRVDVYLPLTARPRVTIGEKVSATLTVLAELD